ncbi:MAG TPA: GDCCVxC domain-containing (seleno)protein [Ktedonobacterales bacterium]|nr:GDCCVxC domain-containing (seleno)protein [Ktedonobacterales bacterium]
MQTVATIHCPHCAFEQAETMPLDACQIVYRCPACGQTLHPKPGDCCVFCSYGSSPCPPKKQEQAGKSAAR